MAGMTRLLLFLQMGQESTFKTGCDTAQGFSRFGQPFGRSFQYRAEAEQFGNWLRDVQAVDAVIHDRLDDAVSESSLVIFATTTSEPYLADEKLFEHSPTVLHLSLRDICPNVILNSQNIVDDVEHSLKARTSLHLTEMEVGNREFVAGTLVDVLEKKIDFDDDRPRIFSPFGLGVLDLGVGNFVLEAASSSGAAMELPHFFSNSNRW